MNIIIAGIGGQGIIFISSIIAEAIKEDVQYCKIFDEGQRNGSVSCHIRIKDEKSPLIPLGKADILIALDRIEGERNKIYLKKDGIYLCNEKENNMFVLGRMSRFLPVKKSEVERIIKRRKNADKNIQDFKKGGQSG